MRNVAYSSFLVQGQACPVKTRSTVVSGQINPDCVYKPVKCLFLLRLTLWNVRSSSLTTFNWVDSTVVRSLVATSPSTNFLVGKQLIHSLSLSLSPRLLLSSLSSQPLFSTFLLSTSDFQPFESHNLSSRFEPRTRFIVSIEVLDIQKCRGYTKARCLTSQTQPRQT